MYILFLTPSLGVPPTFTRVVTPMRWLDDSVVAEHAIAIWSHVCKYIKTVLTLPRSKIPSCASFHTVKTAVNDPLILAKLHFFVPVSKILKPFLAEFQTTKPIAPFLTEGIGHILRELMLKFVEKNVIPSGLQ